MAATDEDRIGELHRNATKYKNSGNWEAAIACLREAEQIKKNTNIAYPIEHYLRLPKFLHQAGLFKESMQEFQILLDETEARILSWLPSHNVAFKEMLAHANYERIYEAMGAACATEGNTQDATIYKASSKEHAKKHKKLFNAKLRSEKKQFKM